ncbi:MAG: hypothetical protein HRT97_01950 [Moritella sp.]|uniref:hypothetical protein n=1 Tax=Moritella sp. TaxID=78556 RepID=UPI0025D847F9|nr:hypothetical protein [Moritella sp.]NQZ91086.1 hypothetical protein [Moritella sp.]
MLNRKLLKVICVLILGVSLQGCMSTSQPQQLTPQEQELRNQMMQAMIAKMKASTVALQSQQNVNQNLQPVPVPKAKPTLTIDDLNHQIEGLESNDTGISFERSRDGIKVNGIMYLDPEGEITRVGSNSLTGEFSYLVHTHGNEYVVKYNKAGSGAEAITLAHATVDSRGAKVVTVTGRKLSGNSVIPTSRGFIVARDSSAFNFDPRDGLNSFSAADGYHIARYQNGDVSSTGYILLEKDPETDSVANLMDSFSSLVGSIGIIEDEAFEYLLANIKTGSVVPLNIRTSGKNIHVLSECRKKNSIVNECAKSESRESLFEPNGSKNLRHYFWKVYWFNTPEGSYAIAQESGLKKITIINLKTAKKSVAFERALGISGFTTTQTPEGKITVDASLGFSTETIDDAVAFFNKQGV